jgi:hypothetical protein
VNVPASTRRAVVFVGLVAALVVPAAAKADPAPQGNQTLRVQWIASGPSQRSGYFTIPHAVGAHVYYVRVRNMNILGWSGVLYAGSTDRSIWMFPGMSTWVDSPVIITRDRLYWFAGDDPISDATSLLIQVWY